MFTPPTRTGRRFRLLIGVLAIVLIAGVVSIPRRAQSLAPFHDEGWTTSATAAADTVSPGDEITIEVIVDADTARHALVDLEINDPAARRVFQRYWDDQSFQPATPRTYKATWKVPSGEPAGTYVVRLGVFRAGWGVLYHWNHVATSFEVRGSSAKTTSADAAERQTPARAETSTTTTTTAAPVVIAPAAPTGPAASPPPEGSLFTESFESPSGFYDRFDFGLSGAHPTVDPNHIREWPGDHNHACAAPDTQRTVHLGANHRQLDEMFWHCAPGGDPAKGHVMTSLNPLGYVYLWFSPKGYFDDVSQVCWDQNLTNMGGRKWTQVSISTRAEVERVEEQVGRLDLGFSHPNFQESDGPSTGVIPTDQTVAVWQYGGLQHLYTAGTELGTNPGAFPSYKIEDVATRYRHCMTDNGNGTITLTQENGSYNGSNASAANLAGRDKVSSTIPGSFPDGEVRVAFVDANYDPPKDEEFDPGQNTWHWDNITIS